MGWATRSNMPAHVKRSPTRTETPDELRSIAEATRRTAAVVDELYERVDKLSKPVHKTGWTEPIGSIGGFGMALRSWADTLDELAAQPEL